MIHCSWNPSMLGFQPGWTFFQSHADTRCSVAALDLPWMSVSSRLVLAALSIRTHSDHNGHTVPMLVLSVPQSWALNHSSRRTMETG